MSDKRNVTTDALETLGTIIDNTQKRDAIHLAVVPVIAAVLLRPGQHVGFVEGSAEKVEPVIGVCWNRPALGIVDPFLGAPVQPGEYFWLVVYPRQITSLRHVWEHPAFPDPEVPTLPSFDKATSEAWLRSFIESADCPDYDSVLAAAVGDHEKNGGEYGYECSRNDGQYLHFGGTGAHGDIPPEFWTHVEVVTGRKIPQHMHARYFSCSC